MKHRAFSILALVLVIVLGVLPVGAAQAPSATGKVAPHAIPPAPDAITILYNQYNNPGANAISSQNFETGNDPYDDFMADDFVVPAGVAWAIVAADVDGVYFNGAGPAQSFNIFVYADAGGRPGNLVAQSLNNTYALVGTSTFRIRASTPLIIRTSGHYWISFQANMDFTIGGQWGWTQRTVQSGSPAMWQNPNGGFGICPTWDLVTTCTGTVDPDGVFRLFGIHRP